jgi:1-pyrroline-5-carboxylate dehydrogenase
VRCYSGDGDAADVHDRIAQPELAAEGVDAARAAQREWRRLPHAGWKSSGLTGKGGLGPYYVQQFAREQSRTIVDTLG